MGVYGKLVHSFVSPAFFAKSVSYKRYDIILAESLFIRVRFGNFVVGIYSIKHEKQS